jgi:hypothetical protein
MPGRNLPACLSRSGLASMEAQIIGNLLRILRTCLIFSACECIRTSCTGDHTQPGAQRGRELVSRCRSQPSLYRRMRRGEARRFAAGRARLEWPRRCAGSAPAHRSGLAADLAPSRPRGRSGHPAGGRRHLDAVGMRRMRRHGRRRPRGRRSVHFQHKSQFQRADGRPRRADLHGVSGDRGGFGGDRGGFGGGRRW